VSTSLAMYITSIDYSLSYSVWQKFNVPLEIGIPKAITLQRNRHSLLTSTGLLCLASVF